jgi:hypothetical protein
MDAIRMVETAFAADFSSDPVDVHARSCVLATVLAYHPSYFIVPRLAARVCVLVGDIPAEKAIVDLDRVGALCIANGVVRPTGAALSLLDDTPAWPDPQFGVTLRRLRSQR